MTAVLASYVKLSTMVDGTLRVVLDIEPKHAAEAFALLGSPGAPIAIARITDAAAVAHDQAAQAEPEKAERKPLSLASKVALTCKEPTFWRFLAESFTNYWDDQLRIVSSNEEKAAAIVRHICEVQSRSSISEYSKAGNSWRHLEANYHDWQRRAA